MNVDAMSWIRYEWFKNKVVARLGREFRGIFGSCTMECGLDAWIAGIHTTLIVKWKIVNWGFILLCE